MRHAIIAALVVLLFVAGCAPTQWDKAGASDQDLLRDRYECKRDARYAGTTVREPYPPGGHYNDPNDAEAVGRAMSNLGSAIHSVGIQGMVFENCMAARGWRK